MATIMAQEQVYGLYPTYMAMGVSRFYGGKEYPRQTQIYGDKEPITTGCHITAYFPPVGLPNCEVEVLLDNNVVGKVTTDWAGFALYTFEQGIRAGSHTIRMWYHGDWFFGECYVDIAITTVGMTQATFTVYVESLTMSVGEAESSLMDQTLGQDIGVQMIRVDVDQQRVLYTFTMWVANEPTKTGTSLELVWWAVLLIVAIAVYLFAAACQLVVTYVLGMWVCSIDGQRFLTCNALAAHMASAHPDVWANVKDKWTCELPAGPFDWVKWLAIGGIGVVGGLVIYEVVKKV